jgi:hypothetical protein
MWWFLQVGGEKLVDNGEKCGEMGEFGWGDWGSGGKVGIGGV